MRHAAALAAVLVSMHALQGCAATQTGEPPRPARISHLAFATLEDKSQTQALIDDCDIYLASIPGIVSYACGTHLDTGRGDAVDGNYDVGIYLGFNSREDLDRYVSHPNHIHVVNKWRPQLKSLRVHDVLDETE